MICVDASVVVKWLVPEEHSAQARALRRRATEAQEQLIAPGLLPIEVSNVLLKQTRRPERISPASVMSLLRDLEHSEIHLYDPAAFHQAALNIAMTYQLPAIYDAYYLALATATTCSLWTADRRLIRTLNGRLPFVHWIGDFPL